MKKLTLLKLIALTLLVAPPALPARSADDYPATPRGYLCIWWSSVGGFTSCDDSVPTGTAPAIIRAKQARHWKEAFGQPTRRRELRACTATGYACTHHRQCCTKHCSDTITGHWCLEPGPGDPRVYPLPRGTRSRAP